MKLKLSSYPSYTLKAGVLSTEWKVLARTFAEIKGFMHTEIAYSIVYVLFGMSVLEF